MSASPYCSIHLRIDGLSVSFADRRVLTDVSLVVSGGELVGLIGENGSGKSTLLRAAAGLVTPNAGTVTAIAAGGGTPSIGLLHQEPTFRPMFTVGRAIESSVARAREAAKAVDRSAQMLADAPDDEIVAERYARALADAERLGAWDVDRRIATMLTGLGLRDVSRQRRTGELSGGQRARLSLASLLLRGPDVLLLDEPTNHLDDEATAHLRGVLRAWPGPVLLASHDRVFLDETVTSLVDLDPAPIPHVVADAVTGDAPGSGIGVTRFTGSYSDYLRARAEAHTRWERQYRDGQAELKRLRAVVQGDQSVGHDDWRPRTEMRAAKKFYADRNARVVSRRVNDARTRLDDLERHQMRRPPAEIRFVGLTAAGAPRPHPAAGPLLTATRVAVSGRLVPTSVTIGANEKWLVTGMNGSGKSTLLHLLAGRLTPSSGQVLVRPHMRIGLLTQDIDIPDPHERGPARSVRQTYQDAVGWERADSVPLSTFELIAGRDENRPLGSLSIGQQRRLSLAIVLAHPPDILLLDEPTNHLSLLLATELEAATKDYPGAVVIASHDRWLRARWSGLHLRLDPNQSDPDTAAPSR